MYLTYSKTERESGYKQNEKSSHISICRKYDIHYPVLEFDETES